MNTDPRLQTWLAALRESVDTSAFVKLQLNKPTLEAEDLKTVDVRPLMI